ncbi:MAG: hypothetical protein U9P14_03780, partial [Gemmatimonadota bacterium]|nr:hypothetical protein [Gemmatimonadota bacterium]
MKNFYTKALLALTALMIFAATACAKPKQYPYRFVYVTGRALDNPDLVGDIREIAKTAGEHGLTGLVLDAYFDRLPQEPPYNFKNLREIVSICKENGLEFVPALMGMGYNAPMLSNDRHLLEGLPVKDALFIVQGGKANVMADPPVSIAGSGFEKEENGRPAGWEVVAGEGAAVRVDRKEAYDGNSSLKVEISGEFAEGSAIVSQEISVHPYRCYRLRCMVKTEGVESRGDVFPILVKSPDGRRLQYYIPPLKDNAGWMQAEVGFNSKHYEKVVLSVGAPESSGGKFWIDSYTIAEDGLVNVLRRGGTPLVVRGENSGIEYEEGKDFAPVYDPVMTLLFDH